MTGKIFIVCYYGAWPPYFREWLYTARRLGAAGYEFLLVTDLDPGCELPANVFLLKMKLEDIQQRISEIVGFECRLSRPYKLCDYRPAYGLIFEDRIRDYDFWGHCDLDVLWGDYGKYVTEDLFGGYDKIQFLGHSVLYRNDPKVNRAFMLYGGEFHFTEVFRSDCSFSFDEHPGMCGIALNNNLKQWASYNQADLSPSFERPVISRFPNYPYQILYWEDGKIIRAYLDGDELKYDDFSYLHFQKKAPAGLTGWDQKDYAPRRILFTAKAMQDVSGAVIDRDFVMRCGGGKGRACDAAEAIRCKMKKLSWFMRQSGEQKKVSVRIRKATRGMAEYYREHEIHA